MKSKISEEKEILQKKKNIKSKSADNRESRESNQWNHHQPETGEAIISASEIIERKEIGEISLPAKMKKTTKRKKMKISRQIIKRSGSFPSISEIRKSIGYRKKENETTAVNRRAAKMKKRKKINQRRRSWKITRKNHREENRENNRRENETHLRRKWHRQSKAK